MRHVTHVIFDLDGTLLDTEPLYLRCFDAIFARHGMTLSRELNARTKGLATPVAVPLVLRESGLPMTEADFIAEMEAVMHELYPGALPLPGALALTAHLRAHEVPVALATSSTRAALERKFLRQREWRDGFAAIVTADDVERSKPAPDIFLEAARRLGAPPEACLVFEDAAAGVQAALAAGMHVVAVPEPGFEANVAGAHEVLESLLAFEPERWGLPAHPRRIAP